MYVFYHSACLDFKYSLFTFELKAFFLKFLNLKLGDTLKFIVYSLQMALKGQKLLGQIRVKEIIF